MKTHVNFYTDEFKPNIVLINPVFVLLLWLVILSGVCFLWAGVTYSLQQDERVLTSLNRQVNEQQKVVDALSTAAATRTENPRLQALLSEKLANKEMQTAILQALDSRETQQQVNYAQMLIDMAKYPSEDLWITHMYLRSDKTEIMGHALNSAAVPKWIVSLSAMPFFRGKQFASAVITREGETNNGTLAFTVSSEIAPSGSSVPKVLKQVNEVRQ
ncbi:PilN domain-containing protein [Aestuariibacter sp. AA17]|uniref:PilN domain-containing protein n=1 Tax=Fluctibacter corallii TaxID=2984329 RepID=A0ABT3AAS9_9ALTE|nr:PilN domain-containing protein [Aestuariibacter sp. AA17]MCV2885791.1 PilN domain-containing protein [Aestuariibacter sp. AA17]